MTTGTMSMTKERLAGWLCDIRKGDLYCPFEKCTWTFFTAFELADHLQEDCQFGTYRGNVPCTHCNEALKSEDLKHHWRITHKDEVTTLASLDKGAATPCPNYLCAKLFKGDFSGCKEYLKHSITCHPLFLCSNCKGEYKSKLILHQHYPVCKGETKREVKKAISKVEARVSRDLTKRPMLTDKEEELHVEKWRREVKSGIFCCPVPSCTKRYFFPNHFTTHLTIESKLDNIFTKVDVVECPYCPNISNWLLLGRHLNDYHRDITKVLNNLRNGIDTVCPNYKCESRKVYTCDTGYEYLQHAINCKPLYKCNKCSLETRQLRYLNKHAITCKGTQDRGGDIKSEGIEHTSTDNSREALVIKNENCAGKVKKKFNMQSKIKKVNFGKQIKKNSVKRKNMALRKRNPQKYKETATIIKSEESSTRAKRKPVVKKSISKRKGRSDSIQNEDASLTNESSQTSHKNTDISLNIDISVGSPLPALESPSANHKAYLQLAIKEKVLKSMSGSSNMSDELEPKCRSVPGKKKKQMELLNEWKSKISQGTFVCGNEECPEHFTLPETMINHMKTCVVDDTNEYIFKASNMECLWCNQEIQMNDFKDHTVQKHSMLLEVLQSETEHFKCQNYDCNTICDNAEDFLQHSVECPTCIVCADCKLTFTSEEDLNGHDCLANDEMFRKRSLDMWRNQTKSGHLQCPNISCSTKFFLHDEFIKHLKICARKSKFCKFALEENMIPCSHCAVSLQCDECSKHFTEDHSEIFNQLQKIKSGENVKCVSYKCKKMFDDAFKYFHHSTVCKPMYFCSSCSTDFNGYKSYSSHPCMQVPEEISVIVPGEWYQYVKDAIFICPNPECEKPFKTFEGLIPHLKMCKKGKGCEVVLKRDVFGCCICKEDFRISEFIDHFTTKHNQIMNQLLKMQITYSLRCDNRTCKKVFVDRGKLLQHYIECSKNIPCKMCGQKCANYRSCRHKRSKSKQSFSLNKWHKEIKKGNLHCPNCGSEFVELEHFIHHMRTCTANTLASKVILVPLPCLICKKEFPAGDLNEHFKSVHTVVFAQLKLIEQGVCIHCPNNGCKEPFTQGPLYLKHVATVCQLNLPCELCGEYFKSKELLNVHQCSEKNNGRDEEVGWDKAKQDQWYEKVMKGDLRCPNMKCSLDFVLPRNFIDHIRTCTEGDACVSVLNRKELPCCFCKKYVLLGRYCSHLASCHKKSNVQDILVVSSDQQCVTPEDIVKGSSGVMVQPVETESITIVNEPAEYESGSMIDQPVVTETGSILDQSLLTYSVSRIGQHVEIESGSISDTIPRRRKSLSRNLKSDSECVSSRSSKPSIEEDSQDELFNRESIGNILAKKRTKTRGRPKMEPLSPIVNSFIDILSPSPLVSQTASSGEVISDQHGVSPAGIVKDSTNMMDRPVEIGSDHQLDQLIETVSGLSSDTKPRRRKSLSRKMKSDSGCILSKDKISSIEKNSQDDTNNELIDRKSTGKVIPTKKPRGRPKREHASPIVSSSIATSSPAAVANQTPTSHEVSCDQYGVSPEDILEVMAIMNKSAESNSDALVDQLVEPEFGSVLDQPVETESVSILDQPVETESGSSDTKPRRRKSLSRKLNSDSECISNKDQISSIEENLQDNTNDELLDRKSIGKGIPTRSTRTRGRSKMELVSPVVTSSVAMPSQTKMVSQTARSGEVSSDHHGVSLIDIVEDFTGISQSVETESGSYSDTKPKRRKSLSRKWKSDSECISSKDKIASIDENSQDDTNDFFGRKPIGKILSSKRTRTRGKAKMESVPPVVTSFVVTPSQAAVVRKSASSSQVSSDQHGDSPADIVEDSTNMMDQPVETEPVSQLDEPVEIESTSLMDQPVEADSGSLIDQSVETESSSLIDEPVKIGSGFLMDQHVEIESSSLIDQPVKTESSSLIDEPVKIKSGSSSNTKQRRRKSFSRKLKSDYGCILSKDKIASIEDNSQDDTNEELLDRKSIGKVITTKMPRGRPKREHASPIVSSSIATSSLAPDINQTFVSSVDVSNAGMSSSVKSISVKDQVVAERNNTACAITKNVSTNEFSADGLKDNAYEKDNILQAQSPKNNFTLLNKKMSTPKGSVVVKEGSIEVQINRLTDVETILENISSPVGKAKKRATRRLRSTSAKGLEDTSEISTTPSDEIDDTPELSETCRSISDILVNFSTLHDGNTEQRHKESLPSKDNDIIQETDFEENLQRPEESLPSKDNNIIQETDFEENLQRPEESLPSKDNNIIQETDFKENLQRPEESLTSKDNDIVQEADYVENLVSHVYTAALQSLDDIDFNKLPRDISESPSKNNVSVEIIQELCVDSASNNAPPTNIDCNQELHNQSLPVTNVMDKKLVKPVIPENFSETPTKLSETYTAINVNTSNVETPKVDRILTHEKQIKQLVKSLLKKRKRKVKHFRRSEPLPVWTITEIAKPKKSDVIDGNTVLTEKSTDAKISFTYETQIEKNIQNIKQGFSRRVNVPDLSLFSKQDLTTKISREVSENQFVSCERFNLQKMNESLKTQEISVETSEKTKIPIETSKTKISVETPKAFDIPVETSSTLGILAEISKVEETAKIEEIPDKVSKFKEVSDEASDCSDFSVIASKIDENPVIYEVKEMPLEISDSNEIPVDASKRNEISVKVSKTNKIPIDKASRITAIPVEASKINEIPLEASKRNEISVEVSKTDKIPVEASKINEIPVETSKRNEIPVEASKINEIPVEASKINEIPVDAPTINKIPVEASKINEIPVDAPKINKIPVEASKINEIPVEASKINKIPVEASKINEIPVEASEINEIPVEESKINEIPVEASKINDIPVEASEINEIPVEESKINEIPVEASKIKEISVEASKINEIPVEASEINEIPVEASKIIEIPAEASEINEIPVEASKIIEIPAEASEIIEIPVEASEINEIPVEASEIKEIPVEASKINEIPVEVSKRNVIPVEASKRNEIPVKASKINEIPVKASKINEIPVEASKINEIPVEASKINVIPNETSKLNEIPVEMSEINEISDQASKVTETLVEIKEIPIKTSKVEEELPDEEPKRDILVKFSKRKKVSRKKIPVDTCKIKEGSVQTSKMEELPAPPKEEIAVKLSEEKEILVDSTETSYISSAGKSLGISLGKSKINEIPVKTSRTSGILDNSNNLFKSNKISDETSNTPEILGKSKMKEITDKTSRMKKSLHETSGSPGVSTEIPKIPVETSTINEISVKTTELNVISVETSESKQVSFETSTISMVSPNICKSQETGKKRISKARKNLVGKSQLPDSSIETQDIQLKIKNAVAENLHVQAKQGDDIIMEAGNNKIHDVLHESKEEPKIAEKSRELPSDSSEDNTCNEHLGEEVSDVKDFSNKSKDCHDISDINEKLDQSCKLYNKSMKSEISSKIDIEETQSLVKKRVERKTNETDSDKDKYFTRPNDSQVKRVHKMSKSLTDHSSGLEIKATDLDGLLNAKVNESCLRKTGSKNGKHMLVEKPGVLKYRSSKQKSAVKFKITDDESDSSQDSSSNTMQTVKSACNDDSYGNEEQDLGKGRKFRKKGRFLSNLFSEKKKYSLRSSSGDEDAGEQSGNKKRRRCGRKDDHHVSVTSGSAKISGYHKENDTTVENNVTQKEQFLGALKLSSKKDDIRSLKRKNQPNFRRNFSSASKMSEKGSPRVQNLTDNIDPESLVDTETDKNSALSDTSLNILDAPFEDKNQESEITGKSKVTSEPAIIKESVVKTEEEIILKLETESEAYEMDEIKLERNKQATPSKGEQEAVGNFDRDASVEHEDISPDKKVLSIVMKEVNAPGLVGEIDSPLVSKDCMEEESCLPFSSLSDSMSETEVENATKSKETSDESIDRNKSEELNEHIVPCEGNVTVSNKKIENISLRISKDVKTHEEISKSTELMTECEPSTMLSTEKGKQTNLSQTEDHLASAQDDNLPNKHQVKVSPENSYEESVSSTLPSSPPTTSHEAAEERNTKLGFLDTYLFNDEEMYLPSDIKETLRSQILGGSLGGQIDDSKKSADVDNSKKSNQIIRTTAQNKDIECKISEPSHMVNEACVSPGQNAGDCEKSRSAVDDILEKETSDPVQKAEPSESLVNVCENAKKDYKVKGDTADSKDTCSMIPLNQKSQLEIVEGIVSPMTENKENLDTRTEACINIPLEHISQEVNKDDVSSDEMSGVGSMHSEMQDDVDEGVVYGDSSSYDARKEELSKSIPQDTGRKVSTEMFSDSDSQGTNASYSCIKSVSSREKAIPRSIEEGIHKVADWLDVKAKIKTKDDKSQVPNVSTVESLFNLSGVVEKVTVTDKIGNFRSPNKKNRNLTDMGDKESIERELLSIQSSLSERNIPGIPSYQNQEIQPLSNGPCYNKLSPEMPVEESTVQSPSTPAHKPAINVSRRFKYGNLKSFNKKKVEGTPKLGPKLPSKLSGIKINASHGSEPSKPVEADILALMSFNSENMKIDDQTNTADIKPVPAVCTSTPAHAKPVDADILALMSFNNENMKIDNRTNIADIKPVPAVCTSTPAHAKPVHADILALMSFNNENMKIDDRTNTADMKPVPAACTSTPAQSDTVSRLFQIPGPNITIPDERNKENFIDFKIEPSDYIPESTIDTESSESMENDPVVITYDSHEEFDKNLVDKWKKGALFTRQRHLSSTFADTEDSGSEIASPIYKPPKSTVPGPPLGSPLKEMLFLIPRDSFDVQESHGESDPGSPCELPELSNVKMKKASRQVNQSPVKVNVEKYSNLSQLEETQVIQHELQDLLSILPTKSMAQMISDAWKDKLFSYNLECNFAECCQTFYDPVSLIEHMHKCMKNSMNKKAAWQSMTKTVSVCPECNKSVAIDMYGKHFEEKHPMLLDMLRELGQNKKVKCKNFKCKAIPTTVLDCVQHFRLCGVKDQSTMSCEHCGYNFKSRKAAVNHRCPEGQEKSDDDDDDDDDNKSAGDVITSSSYAIFTTGTPTVVANPLTICTNNSPDSLKKVLIDQVAVSNLLTIINTPSITTNLNDASSGLSTESNKSRDINNVSAESELDNTEATERLKMLQGICENILTQSSSTLMTNDVVSDETSEILASLEDLNKSIIRSPKEIPICDSVDIPVSNKKIKKRSRKKGDISPDSAEQTENNTHNTDYCKTRKTKKLKLGNLTDINLENDKANTSNLLDTSDSLKLQSDTNNEKLDINLKDKGKKKKRKKVVETEDVISNDSGNSIKKEATEDSLQNLESNSINDKKDSITEKEVTEKKKSKKHLKADVTTINSSDISQENNDNIHIASNSSVKKRKRKMVEHSESNIASDETQDIASSSKKSIKKHSDSNIASDGSQDIASSSKKPIKKHSESNIASDGTRDIASSSKKPIKKHSHNKTEKSDSKHKADSDKTVFPKNKKGKKSDIHKSSDDTKKDSVKNVTFSVNISDPCEVPNETGESSKDEEDWSDPTIWLSNVLKYNFYCPSDHCFKPFYMSNTMVKHIKCCVRKAADYYNMKIKCPECNASMKVRDFGIHLHMKHILLHWYLSELEDGHWVICQNYKCAKYMEDIEESVEHFRRCDYLWKCKYCDIEYKEEKDVERHHCRTTSEEESGNEEENVNNDNEKDNKNNFDIVGSDNEKVNNNNNNNNNNTIVSFDYDRTNKKSSDNIDNIDCQDKERTSSDQNYINETGETSSSNENIVTKNTNKKTTEVKLKKNKEKVTRRKKSEPRISSSNEKDADSPLDSKGREIEKVVKNIKENISKRSGGLSEVALLEWQQEFSKFHFVCPLPRCTFETFNPASLCTHMKNCKLCQEDMDIALFANQIESLTMTCPFDFCKRSDDTLPFADYIRHLMGNHKMLTNYIKAIGAEGKLTCLNFTCAKTITTIDEALSHYSKCKYLWQCPDCFIEYKCENSVRAHKCCQKEKSDPISDEDTSKTESGKKKTRKSATRAKGIISILADELHVKDVKDNKQGAAVGDGDLDAMQNDDDSSSIDEDYNVPSNGSSSTADSDSEESDSSESPLETEEDEIESGKDESKMVWRKKVLILYDGDYFKLWLKENVPNGIHFAEMLPLKENIKFLSECEWKEFVPNISIFPEIEVQYYTNYAKKKLVTMTLEETNVVSPLAGSSTVTFFAGGPVYGMDWCPLPRKEGQYIALTTHRSFAETHCISDVKTEAGCIQLWYVGISDKNNCDCSPRLVMGICHKYGPVYDVKWHPYGFYRKTEDEEDKCRLGVLAVACGDGKVRIYSIPHPKEIPSEESVYVNMKPHTILIPHKSNSFERHRTGVCLCVSWPPRTGSTKLAAGYADGGVRIWDVDTKSILLHVEDMDTTATLPIITIDAHSFSVRSLSWCPYRDNVLVSVSSDKSLKIFDITQPYNPLFLIKRGSFTDVEWTIARFGLLFSEDDAFNIFPGSARMLSLQKYLEEKRTINVDKQGPHATTRHNASVLSISYNNYLDLVATSDVAGEVIVSKDQDVIGSKTSTFIRKVEPVYRIERTELNPDEDEELPENAESTDMTDVECINVVEEYSNHAAKNRNNFLRYKYKFVDANKFEFTKHRKRDDVDIVRFKRTENLQSSPATKYETRAVHKVLWNPNRGCHTWLASGTRLGLVRLHNFYAWRNASNV